MEQWRNEDGNIATWNNFTGDLVTLLRTCFPKAVLPENKCKSTRERMWEQYYKLRSSDEFIQLWKKLFECIKPAQTELITNILAVRDSEGHGGFNKGRIQMH